jgi:hypothetical protein
MEQGSRRETADVHAETLDKGRAGTKQRGRQQGDQAASEGRQAVG